MVAGSRAAMTGRRPGATGGAWMDGFNRDEWAPVLLGFLAVFIGLGAIIFGMLPTWIVMVPLMVVIGLTVVLFVAARRLFLHH